MTLGRLVTDLLSSYLLDSHFTVLLIAWFHARINLVTLATPKVRATNKDSIPSRSSENSYGTFTTDLTASPSTLSSSR